MLDRSMKWCQQDLLASKAFLPCQMTILIQHINYLSFDLEILGESHCEAQSLLKLSSLLCLTMS